MKEEWVGRVVMIMSPTSHYWIGKVESYDLFSVFLTEASWIPQMGRHSDVMCSGVPDAHTEIEPHHAEAITAIPRQGSVIILWPHASWAAWKKQK